MAGRNVLGLCLVMIIGAWLGLAGSASGAGAPPYKPEGEMRWALYVTLAPAWFDPGEAVGELTPFWVLYAIHDALVKPMPGNLMSPSLAESWTVSADEVD
jgi:peptide/nickel transport system substrate-binding protein